MKIRLAAYLQPDSIVDGDGIRTVVWTQGCKHNCPKCHNPETHDMVGGALIEIEEIKKEIKALKNQDGITFSGGDPFYQPRECAELARYIHSLGMNVWAYTGFTFEKLLDMSKNDASVMDFLKEIDILIDGPFIFALKNFNLLYRGSSNQRIIDVKKSLELGYVVIAYQDEVEEDNTFGRNNKYMFV